jgi:iron complex outermembrane recepter protein
MGLRLGSDSMKRFVFSLLASSIALPAYAQRADENAVREAEDAFETSISNEDVGIYNSFVVRGFSPTRAGNIRIDGLYYDQVWAITSRLRRTTTIRIGISAQGFPFPAPTGVVDYSLRKPGSEARLSTVSSIDSYGAQPANACHRRNASDHP